MHLGYNTNGLAHHSLPAAIELLASYGYESVAITIDYGSLNPYSAGHVAELTQIAGLLAEHGLRSVVETGARFLLDARRKHYPTLMSPRDDGMPQRVDFLRRAVDVAAALGSDCVSLWSGAQEPDADEDESWLRLCEGLEAVLTYAERREVVVGFEPEPGMFIDRMDRFAELVERMSSPALRLTLDVGHLHCLGEIPIPPLIHHWAPWLVNVHIEDMRAGVHEHLRFGAGEMDFPPIVAALAEVNYGGGLHIELSRESHDGPAAVRHAAAFLRPLIERSRHELG